MCGKHLYRDVAAAMRVETVNGTFDVCGPCAATLRAGGFVRAEWKLADNNEIRRCQCEHEEHFDRQLAGQR